MHACTPLLQNENAAETNIWCEAMAKWMEARLELPEYRDWQEELTIEEEAASSLASCILEAKVGPCIHPPVT